MRGGESDSNGAILARRPGRAGRRARPALDVWLTFKVNFGQQPGDAVTLVDNQRIPLAGSVFQNRDRIARGFVRLLLKAASLRPLKLLPR